MGLPLTPDGFEAIASSLREEVLAWYERRGERLEGQAGWNTLETNSGFVERRGAPLEDMVCWRLGTPSLEGLRLIDLGCGFGALSAFFAARGAAVTAVDSNDARFEVGQAVAEGHCLRVRFAHGRMQDLPLANGDFDVAVLNNSLCYVVEGEQRDAALAETARVLRVGGVVVCRNPNRWHPRDPFTRLPLVQFLPVDAAAAVARRLGRKRSVAVAISPRQARRELRAAGFTSIHHHAAHGARKAPALKLVARYHHFTALRGGTPMASSCVQAP